MIYTITFNPAIDYAVFVDKLNMGKTNRTTNELFCAGGKGINVSAVLGNLGQKSVALGFIAGFTGKAIAEMTEEMGVAADFIEVEGLSRINVKLKSGVETEINARGPQISAQAQAMLMDKLCRLRSGDYLVLAGSIPSSMPVDIYEKILASLKDKKINAVVDASGDLLRKVLCYKPFLIKPNTQELGELYGVEIESKEDALRYAKRLQEEGARNVIVSMGADGAVMLTEEGDEYALEAPKGRVINTVGSGDSLVAGFIHGYETSRNYLTAFKTGVAAGSASAFSEGLASGEEINIVLKSV